MRRACTRRLFLPLACVALACGMLSASLAPAQLSPPSTDIYLCSLHRSGEELVVGPPRNITDRNGYDNQPFFTDDALGLLFNSDRAGQNDIYRYDIKSGSVTRLTYTPEGEFSPTVLPDGSGLSVVRTEGEGVQRLWRLNPEGKQPVVILPDVRNVGYHAWIDASTVVLFLLGQPPSLHLADLKDGVTERIQEGIGRSIQKIPGRRSVSFVHKLSSERWWIKEYDHESRKVMPLISLSPPGEDHAWTPSGTLLNAQGSRLLRFDRGGPSPKWKELSDLGTVGVRGITRLAVSPGEGLLAFVAERR